MYSDKLTNQFWLKPLAREFYLTRKLPKCISFLRMGGKVIEAVISKVFGVVYYEPEVRISKFKMTNLIWRSHTQNSINFVFFFATISLKTITRRFLKSPKTVANSDFEMTDPIWRPYIRFPVKIRRF